jgi:glycine cleavage system H protein
MSFPDSLLYDKKNCWVKIEDNIAKIGLTDKAAESVKEFVFIEMPEEGKKVSKGEDLLAVEAVKWSGHIESPLSGEVVKTNDEVFDDPSLINKDPYKNWIVKLKVDNLKEKEELLSAEQRKNLE